MLYYPQKTKNSGSVRELQLSYTCAGGFSTYTTDNVRTAGSIIPFLTGEFKFYRSLDVLYSSRCGEVRYPVIPS